MNIYIIDYLGVHCGMHYYNDAFAKILHDVPDTQIHILSNYKTEANKKPFFHFQYQGSIFHKIGCLISNYLILFNFVLRHRNSCLIYLTYGNKIDLPFMWILALAKKHLIDIHEAIAQNVDNSKWLKRMFRNLYASHIKSVIVHSDRTDDFLDEYNYTKKRLYVPHFRYQFCKDCKLTEVREDVMNATIKGKVNILFFGNINISKGIDILIDAVNKLAPDIYEKINVIIAGKDFDHAIEIVKPEHPELFHIMLRHINDDELIYLYQNTDYVVLPYRKTSQSGILEMAFYFHKPIIASCIPYFKEVLDKFPSFGVLAGNNTADLAETLSSIIEQHISPSFFNEKDWNNYMHREEVEVFKRQFTQWKQY
ncbi:glycosyltransferase [Bacteroides oleiciplenus]|uniref:Glycosyl transferase family 1 domain-containing protein n=2 Tax=Bacteroides oleiciplenus TaxID=626931 RepID=K9E284_9BACE|nr:glycosyltransferase [Bacteroides oleiciplenus]EKU89796.1 hypothetical protein HMPREF9447_03234 [Bacteroides oleiciplenus YIT 12058]RGN40365.1 glycosyltransferase family 1 protein [Bacteroides oleiciplenus]